MNQMFQDLKRNIDNGLTEEIPVMIVPEEEVEQPFEVNAMVIEPHKHKKEIKVKSKARKKKHKRKYNRPRKRRPYNSGRNGEER